MQSAREVSSYIEPRAFGKSQVFGPCHGLVPLVELVIYASTRISTDLDSVDYFSPYSTCISANDVTRGYILKRLESMEGTAIYIEVTYN